MNQRQHEELDEFLKYKPEVKAAVDTLTKILRAAQGTLLRNGETEIGFIVDVENVKFEELSGTYRITIEALDD